jgi:hypothetical protein
VNNLSREESELVIVVMLAVQRLGMVESMLPPILRKIADHIDQSELTKQEVG